MPPGFKTNFPTNAPVKNNVVILFSIIDSLGGIRNIT